jgi:DNA-binding Lrp family transcriptional regulator
MTEETKEYSKAMMRNNVDPIDVLILNALSRGASPTTLEQRLAKEYDVPLKRTEIDKRINNLLKKKVLLKPEANETISTITVDPTKVFDHVFLNWLKLPLRPLLRRDELTWRRASERILELDEKWGRHIMILFTPEGEGEYDLVALVCTNDLAKYYEFLEQLTRDELVEKSKTQRVFFPAKFYFNPVLLPSFEECKEAYKHCKERLEQMST